MTAATIPETPARRAPTATKPKAKSGFTALIAVLVLGGVGAIMVATISGGRYELGNYASLYESPEKYVDKNIRVRGIIKHGTTAMTSAAGRPETRFSITDDEGRELKVVYPQAPPDAYKEGRSCIAEGSMNAAGEFVCTRLTVKCPSKYTNENKAMGGNEAVPEQAPSYDDYKSRYGADPAPTGPKS